MANLKCCMSVNQCREDDNLGPVSTLGLSIVVIDKNWGSTYHCFEKSDRETCSVTFTDNLFLSSEFTD